MRNKKRALKAKTYVSKIKYRREQFFSFTYLTVVAVTISTLNLSYVLNYLVSYSVTQFALTRLNMGLSAHKPLL